jgi:hypothetical protein
MVAGGEIVVLSCKNVVIWWLLNVVGVSNGAGFVILGAKKNLMLEMHQEWGS